VLFFGDAKKRKFRWREEKGIKIYNNKKLGA
jgi:hypothetical protein